MKTTAPCFFSRRLQILLPAALLLAFQGASLAQSTWTGANSTAWNTAGNWSPSGVPGSDASVIVDRSSAAYTLSINTSPTLTNWSSNITGNTTIIRASGNQTLNINGVLTKTGAAALTFRSQTTDKLTMTVGTLNLTDSVGSTVNFGTSNNELSTLNVTTANVSTTGGAYTLSLLGANNTADYTIGTLNLGAGGTVIIANGLVTGEQRAINVGSLNGTGGTVRGSNSAASTGVATLNLTGVTGGSFSGTIVNANAITRVVKSGSATQTLNNVNNNYTGGTLISAGTLVAAANNAIGAASGAVEISGANQATLRFNSGVTVGNNITFSSTNATSSIETIVAIGAAFRTGTTGNLTSNFASGTPDTTASILGGNSTAVRTLSMSFSGSSAATNDDTRKSDVFSLSGSSTDLFVLQLSTTGLVDTDIVGWLGGLTWVNAVSGNAGNNAILAQQGYLGSFSAFQTTYGTNLSAYVGAYGVDTTAGSTWAVLNHNSDFAVVAVIPEPSTWALLAGILAFAIGMRRIRRA